MQTTTTTLKPTAPQSNSTDVPMAKRPPKRLEPLARLLEAAERTEQSRQEAVREAEARTPRPFAFD